MERSRAPSIRDVARAAGVSYQTVSRVLNDSERLRPETRERVLAVIAELGYRPNEAARALVTRRSRTIGVVSTPTTHYGPVTSVHAIEVAAREAGYGIRIAHVAADGAIPAVVDELAGHGVEALVVVAPLVGVLDAVRAAAPSVPLVTLDADGGGSLTVDQAAGTRLAMQHLLGLGHRDIVHVAGPDDWHDARDRAAGYARELERAGLAPRPPLAGDWTPASGHRAGIELLRDESVTAVFAANDQMALGVLHAARERGVAVPGRVSVVGFDDVPEAAFFAPPLTTVRQDFAELGRRAVATLVAALGGADAPVATTVTPELVVRGSTAPVGVG